MKELPKAGELAKLARRNPYLLRSKDLKPVKEWLLLLIAVKEIESELYLG